MRDLHSNLQVVQSLDPAITTMTRAGAPIDRQGFESVEHLVLVGMSGDTLSPTDNLSLQLQQSEDGATWSDVINDSDVLGGSVNGSGVFAIVDDPSEDGQAFSVGYVGDARYSRVQVLVGGTHTNGTPVGALSVLSHAMVKPAS